MNKIQVGGFIRISKREAERRYNAGETVRFCACKLSPVNMWVCYRRVMVAAVRGSAGRKGGVIWCLWRCFYSLLW